MLLDALNEHTVDAGAGVDAVASFDNVNVMAPRGRFEVELYLSFLKLIGQVRRSLARTPDMLPLVSARHKAGGRSGATAVLFVVCLDVVWVSCAAHAVVRAAVPIDSLHGCNGDCNHSS